MRLMLEKAIHQLRSIGGYGAVAKSLASRVDELEKLRRMTLFAPDDLSMPPPLPLEVLRLLVAPGLFVTNADLRRAPWGTELPSLDLLERVKITCRGSGIRAGGYFFGIREPDISIVGERIAVHGVERSFHCQVPGILSLSPSWGSAEDQDSPRRRRHVVDIDATSRAKFYLVGNNAP